MPRVRRGAELRTGGDARQMPLLRHGIRAQGKDGESDGLRRIEYQGRGALFTSFVPQGWSAHVIDDGKASASMLALMPLGLRLDAPDSSAQMAFYPYAYYKDFQPGGLKKNNTLDASLVRWRHAVPAADYVSERLQEMYGKKIENVRVQPLEDSSGVIAQRAKGFENDAAQALKKTCRNDGRAVRFLVHARRHGVRGLFSPRRLR